MRRSITLVLACLAAFAGVILVPSQANASDLTPTEQLVVSHVRFVSIMGTPETGTATNAAFDLGVVAQQPYDSARDEDKNGGGRVPLTRDYPSVDYEDANFVHTAQFSFADGRFQWSTRLTSAWQSMARGPVTERSFWYVNNTSPAGGGTSNHTKAPNYWFHGSFDARPGDTIDMANEFTFECISGGKEATCRGTLYSSYYVMG